MLADNKKKTVSFLEPAVSPARRAAAAAGHGSHEAVTQACHVSRGPGTAADTKKEVSSV